MSHRGADNLSEAIDRWLATTGSSGGPLGALADVLADAFPEVSDELARERVRRRLAAYSPRPRTAQQVLIERAIDGFERIGQSVTSEDEYVPWASVLAAAAVLAAAVAGVAYLRHRETQAA